MQNNNNKNINKDESSDSSDTIGAIIGAVIGNLVTMCIVHSLLMIPVTLLWNNSAVPMFGLREASYIQVFMFLLVTNIYTFYKVALREERE